MPSLSSKKISKTASSVAMSPMSPLPHEDCNSDTNSSSSSSTLFGRKKPKFQAKDYCLVFEEAIKDAECLSVFKSFLKNCSSEEMIEFLQEHDRYAQLYSQRKTSYFSSPLTRRSVTSNGSETSYESYTSNTSDLIIDWTQLKQGVQELKEHATKIMETFVAKGSTKEINIGSLQKQALANFEEIEKLMLTVDWKASTPHGQETLMAVLDKLNPTMLFSGMTLAISTDLKFDQFPRFVRSELLFKFLQKKGEKYTRSLGINISQGYEIDIRFKPSDLEDRIIDDKLIYFGLTIMQDTPDWELVKDTDLYQCFLSKTTYFFGKDRKEGGLKLHKSLVHLPYPLEDVWNMVSNPDNHYKFDPKGNEEFKVRDYIAPNNSAMQNPFAMTEIEMEPKLVPFMKRRHFPFILSSFYDHALQGYIVVCRSFNDEPNYPDRVHYEGFNYSIYLPIDDYNSRAIFIDYSDIKLPFSNGAIFDKATYKIHMGGKIKGMLKVLKELSNNGAKRIEQSSNDDRNWRRAVDLHKQLYPERSWYNEWQKMKKF